MKALLRIALVLLSISIAIPVADRLTKAFDPYGISYLAEINRYTQTAIRLSPDHAREGQQGRIFQNLPEVLHEHRRFTFQTDEYGFRRPREWDYAPDETGRYRVLFLGDSVTLGWGVDDEDTWVRRLEREARGPEGEPLRCLNAGHLIYETVQEASLLEAWGPVHRPDLVVVTFVFNDVQPSWNTYLAFAHGQAGPALEPGTSLEAGETGRLTPIVERFAPNIGAVLRFREHRDLYDRTDKSQLAPYKFYPEGLERVLGALDRIRAKAAELGAELALIDQADQRPMPELVAWCEANGVPYIDARLSEEQAAQDVRNSAIDAHANALGNRFIAEYAAQGLIDAGLLTPAPE
ncbi:MAG: hypothetical protein WD226_00930 [Planctomycetota bacterium]